MINNQDMLETPSAETVKSKIDKTIGTNIRRERTARKLSREELGAVLGLTTSHLGLIERGERGATNVVLAKLKNCFKMPIDNFFSDFEVTTSSPKPGTPSTYRRRIDALVDTLTEAELEMLSYTVKGLLNMRDRSVIEG